MIALGDRFSIKNSVILDKIIWNVRKCNLTHNKSTTAWLTCQFALKVEIKERLLSKSTTYYVLNGGWD